MRAKIFWPTLVFANLLVPIAILAFGTGFFPHKTFIPGKARFDDGDQSVRREVPPFDKVIFMVVDALRSDFVYGPSSGFQYTQSLIRSGFAIPFTAHATSPTITMPRVKAITTGSIPSFLDVILNFAESDTTSSLDNQDTWLAQLKDRPGGKLIMFGDDTWLKLFPDTFARTDGTTSFFVSDFTEVDNNVTRNIPSELGRKDWNGMFMHYLGLDHIGHKTGPRGPNMIPKQIEMDAIVRNIYESIERDHHLQSTLLVLCGDHGMNDAGNHGGSAVGETSPALLFLSPKFESISKGLDCPINLPDGRFDYYITVEQSDIAPTLAGLLGFPVPLNNLGVFISKFLPLWNSDFGIRLMQENAQQMLSIIKGTFPSLDFSAEIQPPYCLSPRSDGEALNCLWFAVAMQDTKSGTLEALQKFCQSAQQVMSSTASDYDVLKLYIGISIATVTFLSSVVSTIGFFLKAGPDAIWTAVVAITYGVMMFASSFVEEEQHFWYWWASAWSVWILIKMARSTSDRRSFRTLSATIFLLALRILRRWNQTGQKHAGESDIAKTYLPTHNAFLWALVMAAYVDVGQRLCRRAILWAPRILSMIATAALVVAAIGFKAAFTRADAPELLAGVEVFVARPIRDVSLITHARIVFLGTLALLIFTIGPVIYEKLWTGKSTPGALVFCHDLLSLFLITQTRTTNIPAFLLFEIQYHGLGYLDLSAIDLSLTSLLLQYASFFALGGSNAISSIDLSNAYNGVAGYNAGAVGVLTFISNWAGPIWWTSASILLLTKTKCPEKSEVSFKEHSKALRDVLKDEPSNYLQFVASVTTFTSCSVLSVMLACTSLRTHLFIWTVFSPKYLYIMAWSMAQHLCINIGFGGLLFWIASW